MKTGGLEIDAARAGEIARLLAGPESQSARALLGDEMPESYPPVGVEAGSLEHLLFITLIVSIDYMRDADQLWQAGRETYEDSETRFVFDPERVHRASVSEIRRGLAKHKLSKKPNQDVRIWRTVAVSFHKKWEGDPKRFLADCEWHAPKILQRLKTDEHPLGDRRTYDFPYLRGNKIGPLWIRMLRDNVGLALQGLADVPIPVDIHVLRATVCSGVVRGRYVGRLEPAFERVREAWKTGTNDLLRYDGQSMISLDVDRPLWRLSRSFCTGSGKERPSSCPLQPRCRIAGVQVKGGDCVMTPIK
jgi:hypothetical protein